MKATSYAMTIFVLMCSIISCAPRQIDLSRHSIPEKEKTTFVIVKKIDFDSHGLPLFQSVLNKRPDKVGDAFILVLYAKDKPVKSFDVIIVQQETDLKKPLNVLYTWTGKGFAVGAILGGKTIEIAGGSNAYVFAVGLAMPVVGSAAGFIIGTLAMIPAGTEELRNVLTTGREALINFTEYDYDELGRLKLMKMFQPTNKPIELIKTVYLYSNDQRIPYKTEVFSHPENKLRLIP